MQHFVCTSSDARCTESRSAKKLDKLLSVRVRVVFLQQHADLPANTQNPASIGKGTGRRRPRLSTKRLLQHMLRIPVHCHGSG